MQMGAAILNLSRKNVVSSVFSINYAPLKSQKVKGRALDENTY